MTVANQNSASANDSASQQQPRDPYWDRPPELAEQLKKAASEAKGRLGYLRSALKHICQKMNADIGVLLIDDRGNQTRQIWAPEKARRKEWISACDGLSLDVRYRNQAAVRWIGQPDTDSRRIVLATSVKIPMLGDVGAISLICQNVEKPVAESQLELLHSYVALAIELIPDGSRAAKSNADPSQRTESAIEKVTQYRTFEEFAFAFTNSLKSKLGCDLVAIGLVEGQRIRLKCSSGLDGIDRRRPGIVLIEQAMCEAMDADRPIIESTRGGQATDDRFLLHQKWLQESSASLACSIPLRDSNGLFGVISVRDQRDSPITDRQIEAISHLIDPLIPSIRLLRRADRGIVRHVTDTIAGRSLDSKTLFHKFRPAIFALVTCLLAWLLLGKQTHFVTAPVQFTPAHRYQITAPFSGMLETCRVRSGQSVAEGEELARFDTDPIEAEMDQLQSDLRVAELQLRQALSISDVNLAAQARSKSESLKSQIELNQQRIEQSVIRAPCDGVILWSESLERVASNVAIGERLFEIADSSGMHVELNVAEGDVVYIRKGHLGQLNTLARPDQFLNCEVDSVSGEATHTGGQNRIVCRARLDQPCPDWIKSGMEGVARIDVGQRPVWWIWLHDSVDALRFQLWKI